MLLSSAQSNRLAPRSSLVLIVYHTQHHAANCHVSPNLLSLHIPQRLDHLWIHRHVLSLRSCESCTFFVSPVIRAIVYSLIRQNILFFDRIRKMMRVRCPSPHRRSVFSADHEPGYGNLVLWYLSTQHSTRCIRVKSAFNSHAYLLLQYDEGQGLALCTAAVIGP